MPILSIIVPVYNVAPYLREGLDSILNQEVQDIEILCINDASTDSSISILKEYELQDKRIKIFNHIQNKGLSAARNTGILNAQGEYIAFFDPDDWIEKNMYKEMLHEMKENQTDIVMCGFQTYPGNTTVIPHFPSNIVLNPLQFIGKNFKIHTYNDLCFTWRFLFKRDFIISKKLLFIEAIRYAEDMVFNFAALMQCKRIILIPKPLYHYRVNNTQSIMKQRYNPNMETGLQLQIAEKKRIINTYQVDQYTPITQDMSEDIVKRYTLMLFNNLRNNPNESNKLQGIKRILNMPMITDAMQVVGFRNIYSSWKEYIFYLAMKFKCARLVHKLYFK